MVQWQKQINTHIKRHFLNHLKEKQDSFQQD